MNVVKRITLRIDSRLDCVSLIGVSINALCREHGLDEMASYQVQSATIEAVNNAILHAYDSQPGHSVDVDWLLQDDVVRIDILNGMGREIAGMFGVRAVPTTVVVNGKGEVVLLQAGIPDRGALREAALGAGQTE